MNYLSLKHVSVMAGRSELLRDVNFQVRKGDIVSVIGPNGSGKTTLLKAMLGFIPFRGEILLEGKPVAESLSQIGYVPQHFEFDRTFPITVAEFLRFGGPSSHEERQTLCRDLHIELLVQKRLGELSGGELQRVLIAHAVLKSPSLLLLDEPTSGIDLVGTKTFYDIVGHLNQKHGLTIVLVSHELAMVYNLSTTVVCLNRNMVCFGDPRTVITKEVLEKLYGHHALPHDHEHQ